MKKRKLCVILCCIVLLMGAFPGLAFSSGSRIASQQGGEPRPPVEIEAKLVKIIKKDATAQAIVALVYLADRDLEEVEVSCEAPAGVRIDSAPGKWQKKFKLHKEVPKSVELDLDLDYPGTYDLFFKLVPVSPADSSLSTEAYLRISHGVRIEEPEETENTLEWEGEKVEEGQP